MRVWQLTLTLALLAAAALAQAQPQQQARPQPRYASQGDDCNGTTWPPTLCREGLECRIPPQPPGMPPLSGAGGTCQPEPQRCNLSVYPPQSCPTGQSCITAAGAPPGASGRCRPSP